MSESELKQLLAQLQQLIERLTRLECRVVRVAMHLGLDADGNRR